MVCMAILWYSQCMPKHCLSLIQFVSNWNSSSNCAPSKLFIVITSFYFFLIYMWGLFKVIFNFFIELLLQRELARDNIITFQRISTPFHFLQVRMGFHFIFKQCNHHLIFLYLGLFSIFGLRFFSFEIKFVGKMGKSGQN